MAYSNWGGEVWCNGKALPQNCDVTPKQVLKGLHYDDYMQHYIRKRGADGEWVDLEEIDNMFHAVVGDTKSGVLVALYKNAPRKIWAVDSGRGLHEVPFEWEWIDPDGPEDVIVNFGQVEISLEYCWEPSTINCSFTDGKGRKWRGLSGYCIGEGWQEWH